MEKIYRQTKGFTLIEILVVIGMIAVLATIVIVAINPARQFASSRNTQRLSNVNAILNAIGQNIADNQGQFNCDAQPTTTPEDIRSGSGYMDMMHCLVPNYLSSVLVDPTMQKFNNGTTSYDSHYLVSQDAAGRITVTADDTENGPKISVTP